MNSFIEVSSFPDILAEEVLLNYAEFLYIKPLLAANEVNLLGIVRNSA
jgi:hypothetical protein